MRCDVARAVLQHRPLVDVEVHPHRLAAHHGRQQRRGLDEVTDGDVRLADPAADRSRHARELEVELGFVEGAAGGDDLGVRGAFRRDGGVELLLARRAGRQQALVAGKVGLGLRPRGFPARELALGAQHLRLVGAGIDLEQHVAGLHLVAVLEADLDEIPRDAGADLDRVDGLRPAGGLEEVGDLALGDARDADLGRRQLRHLRLPAARREHDDAERARGARR